jgi:hypothetical protein
MIGIEEACEIMHDAYEKAAVGAGRETQQASRKPWADVPEPNKVTMRAAVQALMDALEKKRRMGSIVQPDRIVIHDH